MEALAEKMTMERARKGKFSMMPVEADDVRAALTHLAITIRVAFAPPFRFEVTPTSTKASF